jgi:hypothetical protein
MRPATKNLHKSAPQQFQGMSTAPRAEKKRRRRRGKRSELLADQPVDRITPVARSPFRSFAIIAGGAPNARYAATAIVAQQLKFPADLAVERIRLTAAQRDGEEDQPPQENELPSVAGPGVTIG